MNIEWIQRWMTRATAKDDAGQVPSGGQRQQEPRRRSGPSAVHVALDEIRVGPVPGSSRASAANDFAPTIPMPMR